MCGSSACAGAGGVGAVVAAVDLRTEGEALGGVLRARRSGDERTPEEVAEPAPEQACLVVAVHRHVDERCPLVVRPLHAERAQDRPLDADARVAVDVALDVLGDVGGELAAVSDLALVHRDSGHAAAFATRRSAA